MGDVYSEEFNNKYLETVKTYKAIMESFSSARARKKLKGKGGKQGEGGKSPNAEGDQVQVVDLEGAASVDTAATVSPPAVSQPK